MTKTEFIALLAQKNGMTTQYADKILNAVLDTIEDALFRSGRVVMRGFGVFDVRESHARMGRNPATGEALEIPASRTVRFRPGAAIKNFLE